MSLKLSKLQTSAVSSANNIENKIEEFPSLNLETFSIIGTAYKGPAFVPKNILSYENENDSVLNSFESLYGNTENNKYTKPIKTMNCGVNSFGETSTRLWFENGGEQAVYTRVLGIGDGTYNNTNTDVFNNSGFYTTSSQLSNDFGSMSSLNVGTSLLCHKLSNVRTNKYDYADSNFIEELGLDSNNNNLFLTDFIITYKGTLPALELNNDITGFHDVVYNGKNQAYPLKKLSNNILKDNNTQIAEVSGNIDFINLANYNTNPFGFFATHLNETKEKNRIFLNGFNNQSGFYPNVINLKDNNYIYYPRPYTEDGCFNYFYDTLKEKGHIVYSSFPVCNMLKNKERSVSNNEYNNTLSDQNIFILNNLSNSSLPDLFNFESQYRKAKTPWVVSQVIHNIDNKTRNNIHEKCKKLFRFHAIDDGEVGNRFRIKISPKKIGSIIDDIYSEFDIYIMEYDLESNYFSVVESYIDVNLNPNSNMYIERVIGTTNEYYDFKNEKIIKEGFYKQESKFLRVEVVKEIKDKIYPTNYLPCGFEAYPHIDLRKDHFNNYKNADTFNLTNSDFNSVFSNVYQMPLVYCPNIFKDKSIVDNNNISKCNNIDNSWGVLFQNIKIENKLFNFYEDEKAISPYFYHTKYFQRNLKENNTVVEDPNYLNSFFHLEKILINRNLDGTIKNWEGSLYKPSGRDCDTEYNLFSNNISYLNVNEDFKNNFNYLKASFDFFTFGGFDGNNILDVNKKLLNNKSVKDEVINNTTKISYKAYEKAIDIVFKNTEYVCDIISVPGLKDLSLSNFIVDRCEDNKTIFIGDIDTTAIEPLKKLECSYSFDDNIRNINSSPRSREQYVIHNQSQDDLYNLRFDSDFTDFKGMGIQSRFYFPVYGDQFDNQIEYSASNIAAGLFANSNFGPVNNEETIIDNEIGLVNMIGYHQEEWENLTKEFIESGLNVFCYNNILSSFRVNLLTSSSTYSDRFSLFRKIYNTRIMNHIKKRIKIDLYTNNNFISGGALFAQNQSTEFIGVKIQEQIISLMNDFVNKEYINDFSVSIDNQSLQKSLEDLKNLKINGNIIIQFKNEDNNRLVDLELNNIINQYSLLADNIVDTEIVIPKI